LLFARDKVLRMRRKDESKHFLVIGDTGVGKSTFIRQILHYAQHCGDTCVVLDSKLEFIPEFFDPRRHDRILSPKDERCVWWDFGAEVTDEVDATLVSRSMYPAHPEQQYQGKWFDDQACAIAAYLWTYSDPRPTCEQFARWLCDPINEILPRLIGSEHLITLNTAAANQFSGVQSTMGQVGKALRMMPRDSEKDCRQVFTIRNWAQDPQGWLFLPNTAETRDALRPLQSGLVDMCIARIMSSPQRARRVWVVLDELDSLGTLSKLHEGMTQLRSSGHPMVLGVQNVSQLEGRYGKQAKTIVSQAFTKLIFAVSEPDSAKTLEQFFGEVEIRRFRESRTGSLWGGHDRNNFSGPEDIRKPAILASQVQGLPDLNGYFVQRPSDDGDGLHIVKVKLPWEQPIFRDRPLVERAIPAMNAPVAETSATPAVQLQTLNSTLSPKAARSDTITAASTPVPSRLTWSGGTTMAEPPKPAVAPPQSTTQAELSFE